MSDANLSRNDKLVFIASLRGQIAYLKRRVELGYYDKGESAAILWQRIAKARMAIKKLLDELKSEQ